MGGAGPESSVPSPAQGRGRGGAAAGHPTTVSIPEKPSIAVLPIQNRSGDADWYFADGITEDIITALSRIPMLFVIARNSRFA